MIDSLIAHVTYVEIMGALFFILDDKSPRSDGFTSFFFLKGHEILLWLILEQQ